MLLKSRKFSAFDFRAESLSKQIRGRRQLSGRGDKGISGGVSGVGGLSRLPEEEEPQPEVEKPTGKKRRVSFMVPHSGDLIQVQLKPLKAWGMQTAEYSSIAAAVMSESHYVNAIGALQQRLHMYQLMAQDVNDLVAKRQRLRRLRRDRQELESAWRNVFAIISFMTSLCLLFLATRLSWKLALEAFV